MSDSNPPTISIVTPSFNQGEFVEWTVRSVLGQRYPNLEYIFMDGGSTDTTLERIGPYRQHFAHFESGPDGGQSKAIAKGFELSRGKIMGYLNSDDLLLPGTLNFVADYFRKHPKVDCIYSHRCIVDEINQVVGHWILPAHSNFLMRRWDLIPQETCFWRRTLFEGKGNVDEGFRFAMDYDLFVRYMEIGNFKRVNRFLGAFRVHRDAKTSTQLESIGKDEVVRVQQQYKIRMFPLLGPAYSLWVQFRSAVFARMRNTHPGLPPGINFDITNAWENMLLPQNSRRGKRHEKNQ